jgi:hypothetical protein
MISIGKETKLRPAKVIEEAMAFFGPQGVGLQVDDSGSGCAHFTGGGGFVTVTACQGEKQTVVSVEAREWEPQAKQFTAKL